MTYAKIRSWHVVKTSEPPVTRCGRPFDSDSETITQLPDEKSCESCLRSVAREVDGWVSG
jgi:hypothetical protein